MLSYAVVQRTREIAMRSALGAQRGDLLIMVFRNGLRSVLIGVVVGLAAAVGLAHAMRGMLVDLKEVDPASLTVAVAILTAVALAAILVPALRATRLDPMIALRGD